MTKIVNIKTDEYDIYIGRQNNRYGLKQNKWANPYIIGNDGTRKEVIKKYKNFLYESGLINEIEELRGYVLGCWCKPKACHGDVLIKILKEKL